MRGRGLIVADQVPVVRQPGRCHTTGTLGPTIKPVSTDNHPLATWVTCVPATRRVATACKDYGLDTPQVLLVLATSKGRDALLGRMISLGLPNPDIKKNQANPILPAVSGSITTFAAEHPDQLLARTGMGVPFTAVDDNGDAYDVWANLEPLVKAAEQ